MKGRVVGCSDDDREYDGTEHGAVQGNRESIVPLVSSPPVTAPIAPPNADGATSAA